MLKKIEAVEGQVCERKEKDKRKEWDPGPVATSCWPLYDVLGFSRETVRHKRCVARSNYKH